MFSAWEAFPSAHRLTAMVIAHLMKTTGNWTKGMKQLLSDSGEQLAEDGGP